MAGISIVTLALAKNYADTHGGGGSTPQRGVDYWTEEDKQEIIDDVLAAIPDGDDVQY